ncbi:MAG: respiratory nitrate reductase subunit gamma [Coriobacteriales bacterium]|jgi:nitrate reductase gamma subunit|nr:respiratory nitrate reductase subunit gamma [Coriobacteriales bacterium]
MVVATLVSVCVIAAMACFLLITAVKARRLKNLPLHSRLELYPVPKEGGGRAKYGGSYFEEVEWWAKPRSIDKVSETREILMEMLFIRKLFQNQRSLWWASWGFHLGIYVMFAWTALLVVHAFWAPAALSWLATAVGVLGFVTATLGALLLLLRRAFDKTLRKYTTPQEYFNIVFILSVLLSGIYCWSAIASPFAVANGVLHFSGQDLPWQVVIHVALLCAMLVYIPLSKMSHYIGKFFSFHKVLWENDPNLPGSHVDQRMHAATSRRPQTSWSAVHVNPPKTTEE